MLALSLGFHTGPAGSVGRCAFLITLLDVRILSIEIRRVAPGQGHSGQGHQ